MKRGARSSGGSRSDAKTPRAAAPKKNLARSGSSTKKRAAVATPTPRVYRPRSRDTAPPPVALRIGHGFDAHRIEAGEGVTLGGVQIPCAWRLIAHSDGDVLIHALCDALLGACALGDIGKFFPDTDAKFKGIDSRELLREVVGRIDDLAYGVVNADLTLIGEVPKVAPHVALMRARLAEDLRIATGAVNVKATTNEKMGHIGRKEGIAGHAVVLIALRPGAGG